MGRAPCCDKGSVKKGPWSPEEDKVLKEYIHKYGTGGNWIALPIKAGLKRCGKSCRLRWLNYLRPNIKHGDFSAEEDMIICNLFSAIGSRWSVIAAQLPGRTDNDIKNYWNTKLKKKLSIMPPPPPHMDHIFFPAAADEELYFELCNNNSISNVGLEHFLMAGCLQQQQQQEDYTTTNNVPLQAKLIFPADTSTHNNISGDTYNASASSSLYGGRQPPEMKPSLVMASSFFCGGPAGDASRFYID